MDEPASPYHFLTRRFSKTEMTRQFIEDSIFTIEYHLAKARIDNNQKTVEAFSDMLIKMRRTLSDLQTDPVTS